MKRFTRIQLIILIVMLMSSILHPSSVLGFESQVVKLWSRGDLDSLRSGIQPGGWLQGTSRDVAAAILTTDGLSAYEQLRILANRNNVPVEEKALVYYHLYGYYCAVHNRDGIIETLRYLHSQPSISSRFFHDGVLPPVPQEGTWAIQIGAFGSRANAERLASTTRSEHDVQVDIIPLRRSNGALYAVWVGRFETSDEARNYGNRHFGRENHDFRVVRHSTE